MQVEDGVDIDVVAAARAGDEQARDRLIAGHLPLVYNVVGRAMNGHPDVDDVVQETMIRVVNGLGSLRDVSSFRSWLVAVAMNEVRRCWSAQRTGSVSALDGMEKLADPAGDFVGLTVLRLGLSGQRREIAEATRWLDQHDQGLLSLWWQEAAGRLTRAELATAMELPPQHVAVRVQRMKEQLELSRIVVRALAATPRCPGLDEVVAAWDQRPSALWRKRIARHTRSCPECSSLGRDLVPTEGLLAGLALVVPLHGFPAHGSLTGWPAAGRPHPSGTARAADSRANSTWRGPSRRLRHGAQLAGALAVAVAVLGVVRALPDQAGTPRAAAPVAVPSTETATALATPLPVQAATTSAVPTPSSAPSNSTPSSTPTATAPARSLEQQLIDLINAERAKSGCRALHADPNLHTAAQQHSQDMATQHYFDHVDRQGRHADSRITAAGYEWSRWGENLDRNTKAPADVLNDWLDGAIHQQNILDCQFTDAGVGVAPATGGPLWTLDLAAPS